jgi:predicted metal-dependent hydrolase
MKITFTILSICIAICIVLPSCSSSSKHAVQYNDTIIKYQSLVVEELNLLDKSFEKGDVQLSEKTRLNAIKQSDISAVAIEKQGNFENNNSLKNAALKLINLYRTLLEKQYAAIIQISDTHLRTFSVFQQKKLDKLRSDIRLELDLALDEFKTKQKEFAGKYGFRLNDVQKES